MTKENKNMVEMTYSRLLEGERYLTDELLQYETTLGIAVQVLRRLSSVEEALDSYRVALDAEIDSRKREAGDAANDDSVLAEIKKEAMEKVGSQTVVFERPMLAATWWGEMVTPASVARHLWLFA